MKKGIIGFILGAIIFGSIGVYAAITYSASQIKYKDTTVEDAINELYENKGNLMIKAGTNNRDSGVETYEVERDCDNAAIISSQISFQFSINNENNYQTMSVLGTTTENIGFYYKNNISLKKGDIIYFKRDTKNRFGYAIIY